MRRLVPAVLTTFPVPASAVPLGCCCRSSWMGGPEPKARRLGEGDRTHSELIPTMEPDRSVINARCCF